MTRSRVRFGVARDVVTLSFATIRANPLRSSLTILGVVIGVTAIVGMTSLIREIGRAHV